MKTHPPRAAGFSLIELLVTISIIGIIIGITFPVINAVKNGSRIEAGLNTISMASDVTRAWATASLPQLDRDADTVNRIFGANYSGTAAIICPTGEIRITINNQRALSGGNYIETGGLNGYADYRQANGGRQDVDYISIPVGTGLAGIYRDNTGARLLAPPFALAYNETGTLVHGLIYYDGNLDDNYDLNDDRTAGYNLSDWSRESVAPDATKLIRPLPFEQIECVAGVVVYDLREAETAGFDFSGGGEYAVGSAGANWLLANGRVVFFSPNTGTALRDEGIVN